ncbi:hypothetical protein A3A39_00795 [Candidatus Kaiserbacteria bacterium RIFCSPLOWO2_01_FULL_54_13]|uniref:Uncharacterized protein n=1 Tax=Candidatus Kaiserbacteria bacterium RIFCSPLOWO2_01_FULL_54_13 TaxID=1798512 RepID=A0A1F6EZT9_9BACT|nr:MAG: hypothetical protein A3A39_00795 [Candidatus Kaiserbacteria bacterium RIFCSPLOWO2_01_FULL_54_13]
MLHMKNLAPGLIRQRVIIELTTRELVGPDEIKKYLLGLVAVTKMERLSGPHTYDAHGMGYAGYVHWKTSGTTVYTYPSECTGHLPLVTVDCYTCKPFDVDEAVGYTRGFFEAVELAHEEVTR